MMMTFFIYSAYQPGDEDVVLDSTILLSTSEPAFEQGMKIFPNPTDDKITVEAFLKNPSPVELRILNAMGELVMSKNWNINERGFMKTFSLASLSAGMYFVELITSEGRVVQQVMKN